MKMKRPEESWQEFWRKVNLNLISRWDPRYESTYYILIKENVVFKDKICLEGGSGTGRVSLRLGEEGAVPILLDVSKKAVKFSKNMARKMHVAAHFMVGSVLNLPFRSSSQDLVWSEGVFEHFVFEQQQVILSESLRVLKIKGKLILIVPNRKAWIYNLLRIISMRMRKWPYGYEEPLTIEDFNKFSPEPIAFHSYGMWRQFIFAAEFLPGSKVLILLVYLLFKVLRNADKFCPGLLLATVWVKSTDIGNPNARC